jgi:hypothetical protein
MQIAPGAKAGKIRYSGRRCDRLASWMILPGDGGTITCSLSYFQRRASLPGRWIARENGQRIPLRRLGELEAVTISIVENGLESECRLPDAQARALLGYFMMDIDRNEAGYRGFDCYAFVSLLTDSMLRPEAPPFEYEERDAKVGDVVVAANGPDLPGSIKHWALCVGENLFISKFGATGLDAQALVETTDRAAILSLYDCDRMLVARKVADAPPWDRARWSVGPGDAARIG